MTTTGSTDSTGHGLALLPGGAISGLEAADDQAVLAALADRLLEAGHVTDTFRDAVQARERRFPTGLPTAVPAAIPHTDPEHVLRPGLAVATLSRPVSFGEMGGSGEARVEVRLVVMLVLKDAHSQISALQHLVARLQDSEAVQDLLEAADDEDLRRRAEGWLGI